PEPDDSCEYRYCAAPREEKLQSKNHRPVRSGASARLVVECLGRDAEGVGAEGEYLAEAATERQRPPVRLIGFPVRRHGCATFEEPAARQVVGEEVLGAKLVDLLVSRAGERPGILEQHPDGPRIGLYE